VLIKTLKPGDLTRRKKQAASLPLNVYENVGGKVYTFFILLIFLQLILIKKKGIKATRHKGKSKKPKANTVLL
jgi:hypothetical protein